jgi:hypothetical protein
MRSDGGHVCGLGLKKPGWPNATAKTAPVQRCQVASGPVAFGHNMVGAVIASQKLRKRFTRSLGALPAIIAALIAPIEIPATQSGVYPEDDSASYTPAW